VVGLAVLLGMPRAVAQDAPAIGALELSVTSGDAATSFRVKLPSGAACPGDSANDGYRINSYMVPAAVDPRTVTYDGTGPIPNVYGRYGDFRQPLYDEFTSSFASAQTEEADAPGEPGRILDLPTFRFAVYGPGELPSGTYHLGITCTLINEIVMIWDTEVEVTASADSLRWHVVGADVGHRRSDAPVALAAVLSATGLLTGYLLLRRRRRLHPAAPSMEDR
jgi:hypothetical protein